MEAKQRAPLLRRGTRAKTSSNSSKKNSNDNTDQNNSLSNNDNGSTINKSFSNTVAGGGGGGGGSALASDCRGKIDREVSHSLNGQLIYWLIDGSTFFFVLVILHIRKVF